MSEETSNLRSVHLTRTGTMAYRSTNTRGGVISIGEGQNSDFTPVELLLVALGACNAVSIEALTKRAEPRRFDVSVEGQNIKDADGGTQLEDLVVTIDLSFEGDEDGRKMTDRIPDAIEKSHHKICTVTRTIERGTPVKVVQVRVPQD